jgi:hypothetical protein
VWLTFAFQKAVLSMFLWADAVVMHSMHLCSSSLLLGRQHFIFLSWAHTFAIQQLRFEHGGNMPPNLTKDVSNTYVNSFDPDLTSHHHQELCQNSGIV